MLHGLEKFRFRKVFIEDPFPWFGLIQLFPWLFLWQLLLLVSLVIPGRSDAIYISKYILLSHFKGDQKVEPDFERSLLAVRVDHGLLCSSELGLFITDEMWSRGNRVE